MMDRLGLGGHLPPGSRMAAMRDGSGDVLVLVRPVPPLRGVALRDVEIWLGGPFITITLRAAAGTDGWTKVGVPDRPASAQYLEQVLGGGWKASRLVHGEINADNDPEWMMGTADAPGWLGRLSAALDDPTDGPAIRDAMPEHDPNLLREIAGLDQASMARRRAQRVMAEPSVRRALSNGAEIGKATVGNSDLVGVIWNLDGADANGITLRQLRLVASVHASEMNATPYLVLIASPVAGTSIADLEAWGKLRPTVTEVSKILGDLLGEPLGDTSMRFFLVSEAREAIFKVRTSDMENGPLGPMIQMLGDPEQRSAWLTGIPHMKGLL